MPSAVDPVSTPEREAPGSEGDLATRRGGLSIREYEMRVWDMARHQLHPCFLFVAAQVAGATRLLEHPSFGGEGSGWREAALFFGGFLGAWACFYSTLLRVAGLRSLTVTLLVPAAIAAAAAIWWAFPAPSEMSQRQALLAAVSLVGPGVIGWAVTMRRWRIARREAVRHLEEERP